MLFIHFKTTYQNIVSYFHQIKNRTEYKKVNEKIESKVTFILILDDSFIDFVTSPFPSISPYVQE